MEFSFLLLVRFLTNSDSNYPHKYSCVSLNRQRDSQAVEQLCFRLPILTESCHSTIYQAVDDNIGQRTSMMGINVGKCRFSIAGLLSSKWLGVSDNGVFLFLLHLEMKPRKTPIFHCVHLCLQLWRRQQPTVANQFSRSNWKSHTFSCEVSSNRHIHTFGKTEDVGEKWRKHESFDLFQSCTLNKAWREVLHWKCAANCQSGLKV